MVVGSALAIQPGTITVLMGDLGAGKSGAAACARRNVRPLIRWHQVNRSASRAPESERVVRCACVPVATVRVGLKLAVGEDFQP